MVRVHSGVGFAPIGAPQRESHRTKEPLSIVLDQLINTPPYFCGIEGTNVVSICVILVPGPRTCFICPCIQKRCESYVGNNSDCRVVDSR